MHFKGIEPPTMPVTHHGNFMKKQVGRREEVMTMATLGADILPPFFIENGYLYTKTYPMTLAAYIERKSIKSVEQLGELATKIDEKIAALHDLGLVHLDLHTQNIVVDPETGDARLIDLGMARWISDLGEADMQDCVKFLPGFCYGSDFIADIVCYEHRMWKMDYF
jgi:tRNA A-37 threonylcarbamoyl transferase component Bud32